jgi:AAA domain
MKILELVAENFKKLRVVEIHPNGRVIQITGKNGQGKTSTLDALWFGLKGRKALPLKPVRKGSERMKVHLDLGDFTVTRTLMDGSTIPSLTLEMKNGKQRNTTPQEFLDGIFGELTFDPLEFIHRRNDETPADHRKRQIAILRKTAKVDLDFEKLAKESEDDYNARKTVNKEADELNGQLAGMTVLDGLPKKKLDEDAILKKLNDAGAANKKAQAAFQNKQELGAAAARLGTARTDNDKFIAEQKAKIERIEQDLRLAKDALKAAETDSKRLAAEHGAAQAKFDTAPAGELVDVAALTMELQNAQRTNRAIDQRAAFDTITAKRDAKRQQSENLTRQMEAREEKKRIAMENAKIPVTGLVFNEREILFNGIPIENLGEGEQIRISTQIGMAANPTLRVLCIRHGEALDEDGLKILGEMAEKNDFQIWMARVDSSGKVGIVLEDGMVVARNEEGS